MACSHRRYRLGDIQLKDEPFLTHINNEFSIVEPMDYWLSTEEKEQVQAWIEKNLICLNLYLYDHGGITMNTSGFYCPWDSGQVGVIYVSKEKVKNEYGWYHLTKRRIRKIEQYLEGEVEVYDQYLRGDVYRYIIEKPDTCESCEHTEMEIIDSLAGFFGDDFKNNGLYEYAGITEAEAEEAVFEL